MLLHCYYDVRLTKSTGNKPGEMIVFTNLFCIDYATETKHRSQSQRASTPSSEANQKWWLLTLPRYLLNGKRSYDFLKLYLNPQNLIVYCLFSYPDYSVVTLLAFFTWRTGCALRHDQLGSRTFPLPLFKGLFQHLQELVRRLCS